MAGRGELKINDKFYFVVDEVGGPSGVESETVPDDELMSSSKDETIPSGKSVSKNNSDVPVASGAENEHTVKRCEISRAAEGDNGNNEVVNINSTESNTSEGGPESVSSDKRQDTPGCPNTEPINMDIDNDSDGEIEQGTDGEEEEPIIKMSFRDEANEKRYKSSSLKCLTQKTRSSTVMNSEDSLEVEINDGKSGNKEDKDVLDFQLDIRPNFNYRSNRVPSYEKNRDVLLSDSHSTESKKTKNEASPSPICFNCCGNHVLRECPHVRNMKVIMRNRNKFQSSKVQKASRYHLDENQKFGHLVPGELTKKLRNALGLREDQQPLFVYRMRVLGYPPAWLEEARVPHSGVAIYDSNEVPITEEGEITSGEEDRFYISKIIEFPGFNVPLQKNMKEEGKHHRCPALSEKQSKEYMIKTLPNAVEAYKKRSLTLQKNSSQETPPQNPEKRFPSPTIEEMEEERRQLLMALNDEDVTDPTTEVTDSTEPIERNLPPDEGQINESKCETPDSKNIKALDYGTPILKSISPYSKLPTREQFSVNVSDVINFENLPNSTGKYESMSSLIHKIRDTVTRIQNE